MSESMDASAWVPERPTVRRLREAASGCRGCELWEDATGVVFSAGPARARLALVGEQPGDVEDQRGEPFVGPAGRVLDEALGAAGLQRSEVYLTNAVKHFRHEQRGKRRIHEKPELRHLIACHPWLESELAAVRPAAVVAMGATAGRAVLGRPVRIGAERGLPIEAPDIGTVVVTTHPSALLRLRGRGDPMAYGDALAALVHDLGVAAELARG